MSKNHILSALFIGLLCGLWAELGGYAGLSVWAGFAGCTAYFASGVHKWEGLALTCICMMFGTLCAIGMATWSGVLPKIGGNTIAVGLLVALIVAVGPIKWLRFVPGSFVGCYTYFGMNGDLKVLIPSLLVGALLGLACDWGAAALFSDKKEPSKETAS